MKEVSIVGLDLAKRVFQARGARADGSVAFRRKLITWSSPGLLQGAAHVRCRNGSLCDRTLLGAGDRQARQ